MRSSAPKYGAVGSNDVENAPQSSYSSVHIELSGNASDSGVVTNDENSKTTRRAAMLSAALFVMVLFAVAIGYTSTSGSTMTSSGVLSNSMLDETSTTSTSSTLSNVFPGTSSDYFIYKHTIPIANGTANQIMKHVNKYLAPVTETASLGCDATKVIGKLIGAKIMLTDDKVNSMEVMSVFHFVDAEELPVVGNDITTWQNRITSLGLDTFNTHHHNKLQMYVPNLAPYIRSFEDDGIPYMSRKSMSIADKKSPVNDIGHVGIMIAGHIYELVGPSSTIPTELDYKFTTWTAEECPEAHSIDQFTLPEIQAYYEEYRATRDKTVKTWEVENDRQAPMAISIGIATTSLDTIRATAESVANITEVVTNTEGTYQSGGCNILRMSFDTSEYMQPYVKYVANDIGYSGLKGFTITEMEKQAALSHTKYTGTREEHGRMDHWDHYLDRHIGLMMRYKMTDSGESLCYDQNVRVRGATEDETVAARSANTVSTHYYVGYDGLMTWEYNIFNCEGKEDFTYDAICACCAANSDNVCAGLGETCSL